MTSLQPAQQKEPKPMPEHQPTAAELRTLIEQFREQAKQNQELQNKLTEQQSVIEQLKKKDERRQVNFMCRETALARVKREASRNGITQNQQLTAIVETWAENNKDGNE